MTESSTPELDWLCLQCKRPIADGEGDLLIRSSDLRAFRRGQAELASKGTAFTVDGAEELRVVSVQDMVDAPDAAGWLPLHHGCDSTPDDCYYSIPVGGISTVLEVLEWTRHLLGKNWLQETDWDSVISCVITGVREATS